MAAVSRPQTLDEDVLIMFPNDYACTLTFGERAENHAGMQLLGEEVKDGFTLVELGEIRDKFQEAGATCELINLNQFLPSEEKGTPAGVLIIRNAVQYITSSESAADLLLLEQYNLPKDTKAFMKGRVVNKLARHNLCFGEVGQAADFPAGKGTIVSFTDVPLLHYLRDGCCGGLPKWFGKKSEKMWCEGNYYYNTNKCGIGFHGDGERKRVIGLRLGASNPLHYQWFSRFKPVGNRCVITLNHGDMYVMSEKAVGTDWKKSSIFTLRHAAGCKKYTTGS